MAQKLDLNKIKEELNSRKTEKVSISTQLGETVFVNSSPMKRDVFLNDLLTSLKSGRETQSSSRIKIVENTVAQKHGEVRKMTVNNVPEQRQNNSHLHNLNEGEMSPEREEQLYLDLEKKKKQTIGQQMEGFAPQRPNYNQQPINYNNQQPQQINEDYLANSVNKIVGNYLGNNLGTILEESTKNVILELYAVERIKTVLNENKKMIKDIVYETIKELQAKNKK